MSGNRLFARVLRGLAPAPEVHTEIRRSWRIVLVATIGSAFSCYVTTYWFGVMVEPLSLAMGWSHARVNGWVSIGIVAACLLSPVSGMIVDRMGERAAALYSIALGALGFAILAAGGRTLPLYYLSAVLVYGTAGGTVFGMARLVTRHFVALRGSVLGLSAAGASLAAMASPRLMQAIVDNFGWSRAFYVAAIMTLIPLPFVLAYVGNGAGGALAPAPVSFEERRAFRIFLNPNFWLLGIGLSLFGLTFGGLLVNLIPLLTAHGMGRTQAAAYAGGVGAGAFLGKLVLGAVLDRMPVGPLAAALQLLAASAFAVFAFAPPDFALLGIFLLAIADGGILVITPYYVSQLFGLSAYGSAYAGLFVIGAVAASGPVLFNLVKEASGSYNAPLLASIGLLFVSAAILALLDWRSNLADATGHSHERGFSRSHSDA